MDIWHALRTTGRRWYVALPVMALGVVASYVLADRVAIEYSSEASMVLVNPETGATVIPPTQLDPEEDAGEATTDPSIDGSGNPWLSFSGSLNTTAQAIQLSVLSQETMRSFEEAGLSTNYEVATDRRNPILLMKVTSDDPVVTQRTLERLVALINEDLTRRQEDAGAAEDRRIHAEVLAIDDTPERLVAARLRVRLATLGLGVVAGVLAAVAVDALAGRGRRPSDGHPPEQEGASHDRTPDRAPAPDLRAPAPAEAAADDRRVLVSRRASTDPPRAPSTGLVLAEERSDPAGAPSDDQPLVVEPAHGMVG